MVKIMSCDATECSYNADKQCHAFAVTIGGGIDHKCDTFCKMENAGGAPDTTAGVGACKVTSCSHNESLECAAPGIRIGHEGTEVDCLTFSPR